MLLPYNMKKSTETFHREAKTYCLVHRRRLHMLGFAFDLSNDISYLDRRNNFNIMKFDHYKCLQNPMCRAMLEWNTLNVEARNTFNKKSFLFIVRKQIVNPYKKILICHIIITVIFTTKRPFLTYIICPPHRRM